MSNMKASVLQTAPGTHAARVLGVLSVLGPFVGMVWLLLLPFWFAFWWFILMVPLMVGFGIWNHLKARNATRRATDRFEPVSRLHFRLCLWGLAFNTLFLAIFVPAIWVNVITGRDRYTVDTAVKEPVTAVVDAYPALVHSRTNHEDVVKDMESILDRTNTQWPNAWDHAHPLVNPHIKEVQQRAPEILEACARADAKQLGQGVFIIAFPTSDHPGYLAAAARLKEGRFATGGPDSKIYSQVVALPPIN